MQLWRKSISCDLLKKKKQDILCTYDVFKSVLSREETMVLLCPEISSWYRSTKVSSNVLNTVLIMHLEHLALWPFILMSHYSSGLHGYKPLSALFFITFWLLWMEARAEREPPLSCRPSHLSMKQLNMTSFCKCLHFCPDCFVHSPLPATRQKNVSSERHGFGQSCFRETSTRITFKRVPEVPSVTSGAGSWCQLRRVAWKSVGAGTTKGSKAWTDLVWAQRKAEEALWLKRMQNTFTSKWPASDCRVFHWAAATW